MAELQDSDKFLINRSGKSYQVTKDNLMAELQDDDLLLVNRSNKSYKVTGKEFKESLSAPPIIQSVTLVQDEAAGGGAPAQIETDEITAVNTVTLDYASDCSGSLGNSTTFAQMFDGDENTSALANTSTTCTWNPSSPLSFTKLRVRINTGTTGWNLKVNGTTFNNANTPNNLNRRVWIDVPGVSSPLTSMEWSTGVIAQDSTGICGVEINGLVLIDGPSTSLTFASDKDLAKLETFDYIQQENAVGSTKYSDAVITENAPINGRGPELMFDGDESTSFAVNGAPSGSTIITFTPAVPCTSLRMKLGAVGATSGGSVNVNGVNKGALQGGAIAWVDYGAPTGNKLEKIHFDNATDVGHVVAAIEVDGSNLVDGSGYEPSGFVSTIDVAGKTVTLASSNGTWGPPNTSHYAIGPVRGSSPGRFTDRDFTTTVAMLDNGNPPSTKSIRGWVEGSLTDTIETDVITAVDTVNVSLTTDAGARTVLSATPDFRSGYGPEKAFIRKSYLDADFGKNRCTGDIVTDETAQAEANGILIFSPPDKSGTWTFIFRQINNATATMISINGEPFYSPGTCGTGNIYRVVTFTGILESFRVKGDGGFGPTLLAVFKNSEQYLSSTTTKLTFASDKGLANLKYGDDISQEDANSIDYSSNISGAVTPTTGREIDKAFDGEEELTYWQQSGATTATWNTAGQGLPALTELRIVRPSGTKKAYSIQVNGSDISSSTVELIDTFTVSSTVDPVIEIVAGTNAPYNGAYIAQIFWNGKLLLDGNFAPAGVVDSIDVASTSLVVASDTGGWGPANDGHYAIGPSTTIDNAKKYLNLDASLNVIGLNDDDSYTRTPANTFTPKISFPGTLDNGEAPDTALPAGTSIQTEILAENTAGSDEMESNVYTPTSSCVSGPIETDEITNVQTTQNPIYSDNVVLSAGGWLRAPSFAFNGDVTTNAATDIKEHFTITFSPALQDVNLLEVYIVDTDEGKWAITGSGLTKTVVGPKAGKWTEVPCGQTVTTLKVSVEQQNFGGSLRSHLAAIRVNGKVLVDGAAEAELTFSSDKGLDKLQPGDFVQQENSTSSLSWTGPTSDTGSVSPTLNNGAIIAESDTQQVYQVTALVANSGIQTYSSDDGINWTLLGTTGKDGNGTTITTPATKFVVAGGSGTNARQITSSGSFEWAEWNEDTFFDQKSDGVKDIFSITTSPSGIIGSVDVAGNSITLASSKGTWGPADNGHYAIGGNYVCPAIALSADNPADVKTFNYIKDFLDDYAGERAQFRADLRQRLIDAGFSQEEMTTMLLVDDGEVAFSKDGYFPLYLTEEEANRASANGSSHAHVMDGETYYMPDTGVTLYHGTYGLPPEDTSAGTADISDVADNTDTTGTADISDDDSGDSSY